MTVPSDTAAAPQARPGSTPAAERSLAPDLARGVMLLLIALAHVPWFMYASSPGSAMLHPADGSVADRIAQVVTIVAVDGRVHTMFGFLFAYGIGQLVARQAARGADERRVRRVLRRRHLWLLAFGLLHAALLWQGDILGIYGVLGLLLVPLFLGRSDRTIAIWIGALLAVAFLATVLGTIATIVGPAGPSPAAAQHAISGADGYAETILPRLLVWGPGLASGVASLALPIAFLAGLLSARHRLLDDPAAHLPLLRLLAVGGIGIGWAVGAAEALAHVGVIQLPAPTTLAGVTFLSGIPAGIGYAALFGLVAARLSRRGRLPAPVVWVRALGRRSLSGYLAQSLLFVPILSAWGLGVGAGLTSATAFGVGVAVWLVTVAAAAVLDRAGRRGPAEVALRRLTYRA